MSMAIFTGLWAVLNGVWAIYYDTGWRFAYAACAVVFSAACAILWQDAMKPKEEGGRS